MTADSGGCFLEESEEDEALAVGAGVVFEDVEAGFSGAGEDVGDAEGVGVFFDFTSEFAGPAFKFFAVIFKTVEGVDFKEQQSARFEDAMEFCPYSCRSESVIEHVHAGDDWEVVVREFE